jgi:hypothetical protein
MGDILRCRPNRRVRARCCRGLFPKEPVEQRRHDDTIHEGLKFCGHCGVPTLKYGGPSQ